MLIYWVDATHPTIAASEVGFYPGGITEISRGLSDSDTPRSRTRKEFSSSRGDDRRGGLKQGLFEDSNTDALWGPSENLRWGFSEIESRSSGIPPD